MNKHNKEYILVPSGWYSNLIDCNIRTVKDRFVYLADARKAAKRYNLSIVCIKYAVNSTAVLYWYLV